MLVTQGNEGRQGGNQDFIYCRKISLKKNNNNNNKNKNINDNYGIGNNINNDR